MRKRHQAAALQIGLDRQRFASISASLPFEIAPSAVHTLRGAENPLIKLLFIEG